MRIKNQILESAKSMTSSFVTIASEIEYSYGFAMFIRWTAGTAPTGNFQVQGSLLPDFENGVTRDDTLTSIDWVNIGSAVAAGGGLGKSLVNFDAQYYPYVRVTYTAATNTATAYIRIYKKGPG